MSKPLSTHSRLLLTGTPGALVTNIVRMGLYWLCVSVLLWSRPHPLTEWRSLTVLCYLTVSALIVPTLGYVSLRLRAYGSSPLSDKNTHALSQTVLIAIETVIVVLSAVAVESLLF